MSALGLCKQIRRVVLSQEEMINCCGDFDPEPFCEFLILDTEVSDGVFDLDLSK